MLSEDLVVLRPAWSAVSLSLGEEIPCLGISCKDGCVCQKTGCPGERRLDLTKTGLGQARLGEVNARESLKLAAQ